MAREALIESAEGVASEILSRLAGVTVALGYETDVGASVFAGRKRIDDDQIPCVVLIEGGDVPSRSGPSRTSHKVVQHYVLQAYLACDPNAPNTAAHKAIRDLKRAIFRTAGKPDPTWNGKVSEVRYLGRDIGPRSDGSAFVVAVIEIEIDFVEDVANP